MANSTQTFNPENSTILFKRSTDYNYTGTDASRLAIKEAVQDKILLYGEPMLLQDIDSAHHNVFVIGDGILDKNTNTVTGRTVKTLIEEGDYYCSALAPVLQTPTINGPTLCKYTSGSTVVYPTLDESPDSTDDSTRIATTAFVHDVVESEVSAAKKKTNNVTDTIYLTGVKAPGTTTETTDSLYFCKGNTANASGVRVDCSKGVLLGAAWNDFAEFRECKCNIPGTVVCETGKGDLTISTEKLQSGAAVITDTYGMIIGDDQVGNEPIAVAGRVLVKYSRELSEYTPGLAVCAGPEGKILPMSREEIKEYPDRILGYVSEIPSYPEWNGIEINDRIWIKIK